MAPQAMLALLIVICLPIAWFLSEFSKRRGLRIALGIGAIASSIGVAYLVGHFSRWNYNAWYGFATKDLVDTAITEIEDGNIDRVMKVLRRVNLDYRPTYENRAHYDEIVRDAVAQMKAEGIITASKWDTAPFTQDTWIGHWENDTGFWLVIDDGLKNLRIQRSGDSMRKMHNVTLTADARTLTFDESDRWHHKLTLVNKYEARHEWREANTGRVWKREMIHKLIRATPDQRRFTQQDLDP